MNSHGKNLKNKLESENNKKLKNVKELNKNFWLLRNTKPN